MTALDGDVTACAALVEKADPDRFRAAMASPPAARAALFPLYAFNVEVSRAPWVTQEPMIAEMRLQWWRDALAEIASGQGVRRHEVVTPLARVLDGEGARVLDRLVAARRWDLYRDPFEDEAHFAGYLEDTAGGLMWAAARALGADDAHEAGLRRLGAAAGLARFLQAVPELEARGRVPLVDGRPQAVAALAGQALRDLAGARALRRRLGPAGAALTEAHLAAPLLARAKAQPGLVARGGLQLSPLRRAWQLWRWS